MAHYIALIHKEPDSCYGVSFPDVAGVITAGDTIDEAIRQAAEVLAFAAEEWGEHSATPFPPPRTIDDLRADPEFRANAADAIIAAVPLTPTLDQAAA
jgi:predicted RNase H-like HicB family nuclease